jgi:hypothetical protein
MAPKSKAGWLERRREKRDEKKKRRAAHAADQRREARLVARRETRVPGADFGQTDHGHRRP